MAAAYNSREIVDVFLRHRLLSSVLPHRGVTSLRRPNHAITSHRDVIQDEIQDHSSALSRLQFVLRCTSNDLERRSHSAFEAHVSALLLLDGEGVEHLRSLRAVTEELFRDTVNWGRIVAMMALGGVLCSEMVRMGGGQWVDDIAQWMEETLESPMIREWIEDNGGWDAFVELYGESRPAFSFLSLKTLFGLVLLGAAGIMLGLLVKALKLKFF